MGSDNVHLYNRNKHVYSLVQKKISNFMLMTTIWMNFYRTHLNHTKAFQLNSELFRMAAEPDYILKASVFTEFEPFQYLLFWSKWTRCRGQLRGLKNWKATWQPRWELFSLSSKQQVKKMVSSTSAHCLPHQQKRKKDWAERGESHWSALKHSMCILRIGEKRQKKTWERNVLSALANKLHYFPRRRGEKSTETETGKSSNVQFY